MAYFLTTKLTPGAAALALLFAPLSYGQTNPQRLDGVTVTAKTAPVLDAEYADVGGLGAPLAKTPQSISVLAADLLAATGTSTLSQAIKLDASLADSYNTTGYIESLSIRGFLLDQGGNFLRNGLATTNYVPLALENKERVEILKGVAGLQAGVSAPGGLVNFVTKVPLAEAFTTVTLAADEHGGSKLHLDTSTAWSGLGVRINLASEGLRTHFDHADGSREFASIALAKSLSPDTSIAADFEYHRKQQPSVPGVGLLDRNGDGVGDTLPATINPRLNLNNQIWSQPFESVSTTAQLTLQQSFNAHWQARVGLSLQRTRINDRLAFPDGCSSAANYVYPGLCANGEVDVYDYRSEGEERGVAGWDVRLTGNVSALGTTHRLALGLGGHESHADLAPLQAYNFVGTTNIDAPVALPSDSSLTVLNTNSHDKALDVYVSLTSALGSNMQAFVGMRASRLERSSARSDGTEAVALGQTVSTPWAGLAWTPAASTLMYASWGQGAEMESVPNRPDLFVNYGEALPALKSEQSEVGLKWQANARLLLTAAAFNISKPLADDVVNADGPALRMAGRKTARHRGLEFGASGRVDEQLSIHASATVLDAVYTQAQDTSLAGRAVTNIPRVKASVFADYKLVAAPGLAMNALWTYEHGKTVTADGSVTLPDAWQLDAGVRYQQKMAGKATQWRLNVENLTDRNYWREAPTQYWGGIYLFPSTPRTLRASVTVDF